MRANRRSGSTQGVVHYAMVRDSMRAALGCGLGALMRFSRVQFGRPLSLDRLRGAVEHAAKPGLLRRDPVKRSPERFGRALRVQHRDFRFFESCGSFGDSNLGLSVGVLQGSCWFFGLLESLRGLLDGSFLRIKLRAHVSETAARGLKLIKRGELLCRLF